MSSGTDLITTAYKKIGVYTTINSPPPDAINVGMNELNSWLHFVTSKGIAIPFYVLTVPGDDLEEPMDCTLIITNNLAVKLSVYYDNGVDMVLSKTLKDDAADGMRMLSNQYSSFVIPDKGVSSTMPLGQGSKLYRYWRNFAGRDGRIGN